jgi:hypothetical protein
MSLELAAQQPGVKAVKKPSNAAADFYRVGKLLGKSQGHSSIEFGIRNIKPLANFGRQSSVVWSNLIQVGTPKFVASLLFTSARLIGFKIHSPKGSSERSQPSDLALSGRPAGKCSQKPHKYIEKRRIASKRLRLSRCCWKARSDSVIKVVDVASFHRKYWQGSNIGKSRCKRS